jgi:ABC-2 type transport system permease protein
VVGALGAFQSSVIRQLENFAGVMNFVIFPIFLLSSALYPLWKMAEASPLLARLCTVSPFTQAVELIRFAACAQMTCPRSAEPVSPLSSSRLPLCAASTRPAA